MNTFNEESKKGETKKNVFKIYVTHETAKKRNETKSEIVSFSMCAECGFLRSLALICLPMPSDK